MASPEPSNEEPSTSWRFGSSVVMGLTGLLSRTFLLAANRLECYGLEEFVGLLEERADPGMRTRGLITVSNHLSVLDDPLIWGALPYRYHWKPDSMRWSLGSQDLMFKQRALCTFFSLGQCLPTHRLAHSPYGGLFQPTITQSIRLLSQNISRESPAFGPPDRADCTIADPFSEPYGPTFFSSPLDPFPYPSPSYYHSRRYAWVHVFPEGRIHQHPERMMRYFKWGVARLILESDPAPTLVPIWIEGFENIMHESREFPRFLPRLGKDVAVTFGRKVDTDEGRFEDLRRRWRDLVEKERRRLASNWFGFRATPADAELTLMERLKYGAEATKLREECTLRVRDEVLKVRRSRGWPEEDPKARRLDTWLEEGQEIRREGKMNDGSWVKDT